MYLYYPPTKEKVVGWTTKSWFDISTTSCCNPNNKIIKTNCSKPFIRTYKIKLFPTKTQLCTLLKWFDDVIDVYNIVAEYIQGRIDPLIKLISSNNIIINEYIKLKKYRFSLDFNIKKTTNVTLIDKLATKILEIDAKISETFGNYTIAINNNKILRKNINKIVNYFDIRKLFYRRLQIISNTNGCCKHTLDESVHHCVSMFKSAVSNLVSGYQTNFKIKPLLKSRNRKQLIVDKQSFSKNGNAFFSSMLGKNFNSDRLFEDIVKGECILQYNVRQNTMYLLCPNMITPQKVNHLEEYVYENDKKFTNIVDTFPGTDPRVISGNHKRHAYKNQPQITLYKKPKCGIDMGLRTFLSCYDEELVIEICDSKVSYPIIDKYLNKIDTLNRHKDEGHINAKKYKKVYERVSNKMQNRIKDLHNRAANILLKRYKVINIGNISVKSVISNNKNTNDNNDVVKKKLSKRNKRRLAVLSLYAFRERLIQLSKKWHCKVNVVSEYMTSKECHACGSINDVGMSKIYNCQKCKIMLDRDTNAAINIWKK